ncbi:hypothetical protein ACKC9G_14190 [Pokkaliibacter sp. CJK22405]|uniref:hypothetical protein n=1 Tax=Pokkaliibacter sp. CJK22405 TaxID=3384615 RepID=UPI003984A00D
MERLLSSDWITHFFGYTGRLVSLGKYKGDHELESNIGIVAYTAVFMLASLYYWVSA